MQDSLFVEVDWQQHRDRKENYGHEQTEDIIKASELDPELPDAILLECKRVRHQEHSQSHIDEGL